MKLTVPPLEITPDEGFSADKDIFKREGFGKNLLNIIENINDELVLAIDAPWGEGKTTFIKMWRGMLAQEEIQSIYFDAFENDYQEDSFLAIAAEIYSIIDDGKETVKSQFKEKTVSALKTLGRAGLRITTKALTGIALDETIFEDPNTIKDVSKEASDLVDSYVSQRLENAKQDKKNLKEFKQTLDNLASNIGNDKPLVFIIDELDRCKPPFALAILENIKHLYSVKNIVFVLVMNRTQIEESVKCEYGSGVEASKYLQKFVHLWASLPKKRDKRLCDAGTYLSDCLERMDFTIKTQEQRDGIKTYKQLISHYNLSLREIERSLTNYALVHNIKNGKLNVDYHHVLVYLSIIKVIYPQDYYRVSNENISYEELVDNTSLEKLQDKFYLEDFYIDEHYLKFLLRCCLSNKEELQNFIDANIENSQPIQYLYSDINKSMIKQICTYMNVVNAT